MKIHKRIAGLEFDNIECFAAARTARCAIKPTFRGFFNPRQQRFTALACIGGPLGDGSRQFSRLLERAIQVREIRRRRRSTQCRACQNRSIIGREALVSQSVIKRAVLRCGRKDVTKAVATSKRVLQPQASLLFEKCLLPLDRKAPIDLLPRSVALADCMAKLVENYLCEAVVGIELLPGGYRKRARPIRGSIGVITATNVQSEPTGER